MLYVMLCVLCVRFELHCNADGIKLKHNMFNCLKIYNQANLNSMSIENRYSNKFIRTTRNALQEI